jgi:putative membrane protein insertion efficiency factor
MRKIVAKIIEFYQRTLSPDYGLPKVFYPGGYCKFTPTCSEYTKQAVLKYGVILGLIKGAWRILRCNPWSKGGNDPA